jgi:hypothetical protein
MNKVIKQIIFCLVFTWMCGCKDKPKIDDLSSLSPDGKYLAIRVGAPSDMSPDAPVFFKTTIKLLDLESNPCSFVSLPDNQYVSPFMGWRAYDNQVEFYYQTVSDINHIGNFIGVMVNGGIHTISCSSLNKYPNFAGGFSWNPNSTIIAGISTRHPMLSPDGELVVSFDEGRSLILTTVSCCGLPPVWINSDDFYIQTTRSKVSKIRIKPQQGVDVLSVIDYENEKDFRIYGILADKPICVTREGVVYWEKEKIFTPQNKKISVVGQATCLIICADNYLYIYDIDGKLMRQKQLPPNCDVLSFSEHKQDIYILRDHQIIERYSILKDEISHIFDNR